MLEKGRALLLLYIHTHETTRYWFKKLKYASTLFKINVIDEYKSSSEVFNDEWITI